MKVNNTFKAHTYVFLVMLLLLTVGIALAKERPPTKVTTTLQVSDGLTENDFTLEMLSALEEWAAAEFLENSKESFLSQGYSEDQFDGAVRSTSHYMKHSGKKLGVINATAFLKRTNQTVMQMVRVIGFVDEGIATVGCLRQSEEKIPVTFGACGKKIKEVFHSL